MRNPKNNMGCIIPLTLLATVVILIGVGAAAYLYSQGEKLSGNELTKGASENFYLAAWATGAIICLIGLIGLGIGALLQEVDAIAKAQRALADQMQSIKAATVSKCE